MKSNEAILSRCCLLLSRYCLLPAACCLLLFAFAGCASGGDDGLASSGDPEADLRAEQRIGDENDNDKDRKDQPRTLYERIGGAEGVARIVDEITERVIADPRVNFERSNVREGFLRGKYEPWEATAENIGRFKQHMIEFISLAAGGPAGYTGRDLRSLHQGMKITNAEFDAMVGDIKVSTDKLGLGTREKRDLLAIIETTRKQIVEEN